MTPGYPIVSCVEWKRACVMNGERGAGAHDGDGSLGETIRFDAGNLSLFRPVNQASWLSECPQRDCK